MIGNQLEHRLNTQETSGYWIWVNEEPEDPDWDAFLAKTPGGHYTQSSLWAKMKALSGWKATRLVVAREDSIIAGAQLLTRPLPLFGKIGYIPKGPLVASDDIHLSKLVINALHRLAKAHGVEYLAVQPPSKGQITHLLPGLGFHANPKMGTVTSTILIDLTRDPNILLAQMRESTRTNIRRAQSRGITIREGTESDLGAFYHLVAVASQRKGYSTYSKKFLAEFWQILGSHGHTKLFFAEYAGEAVSTLLAIHFGDTLFTHVSAWDGRHRELKPNELLEWETMMWAKAHGYRYYDFEGIDPQVAKVILQGQPLADSHFPVADRMVTRYKLGFGGRVTLLPEVYEYIYSPLLRSVYFQLLPKIEHWPVIAKTWKAVTRAVQPNV